MSQGEPDVQHAEHQDRGIHEALFESSRREQAGGQQGDQDDEKDRAFRRQPRPLQARQQEPRRPQSEPHRDRS